MCLFYSSYFPHICLLFLSYFHFFLPELMCPSWPYTLLSLPSFSPFLLSLPSFSPFYLSLVSLPSFSPFSLPSLSPFSLPSLSLSLGSPISEHERVPRHQREDRDHQSASRTQCRAAHTLLHTHTLLLILILLLLLLFVIIVSSSPIIVICSALFK